MKKQLKKYKNAAKYSEKNIDPNYLSKKSLIKHIMEINERKQ